MVLNTGMRQPRVGAAKVNIYTHISSYRPRLELPWPYLASLGAHLSPSLAEATFLYQSPLHGGNEVQRYHDAKQLAYMEFALCGLPDS